MAVWLVRAIGHKPLTTDTSRFSDVADDEWWLPYAERLARLKVTEGCKTEPLRYCPSSSVTRAQMATFFVRAFDLEPAPRSGFVDVQGGPHAVNIDALAAAGITSGCKTNPLSYCPDEPVTRAQMATFLRRAIQSSDRAILAALYYATGGPKWSARTKWLSNTEIGTWYGVLTDEDGRVKLLDLSDNGLKGSIPSAVGGLSELSSLDLSNNQLSGRIPWQLGNLSQLRQLHLSANELRGHIPKKLGDLTLLDSLFLDYNELEGTIPPELGGLAYLWMFRLAGNKLSGSIPTELGRLTKLVDLRLRFNQLSGTIPSEIFELSLLESLLLGDNELSGPLPRELSRLSNLETLDLSDNSFHGPIPEETRYLKYLQVLYLADNDLSGPIPPPTGKTQKTQDS